MKDEVKRYINFALDLSEHSDCLRRKYGAVIVNSIGDIVSIGWNAVPSGCKTCEQMGGCFRNKKHFQKGSGYLVCPDIHAEQNCILRADSFGLCHTTIYIGGYDIKEDGTKGGYAYPEPCLLCHKLLIQAGVERCFGITEDGIVEIDISKKRFQERLELERARINMQICE